MKRKRIAYLAGGVFCCAMGVVSLLTITEENPWGHIIGAASFFLVGVLLLYIGICLSNLTPEQELKMTLKTEKFLIPVKKLAKGNIEQHGQSVTLKKGTTISIPILTVKMEEEERPAIPVFSDRKEFRKMYSYKEFSAWLWTAEDFLSASYDVFLLNPGGKAYVLRKDFICRLMENQNILEDSPKDR